MRASVGFGQILKVLDFEIVVFIIALEIIHGTKYFNNKLVKFNNKSFCYV